MKHKITFKTPNVTEWFLSHEREKLINKEICPELVEDNIENLKQLFGKFIKHDEYISIEFDDEKQTATVLKIKE